MGSIGFVFSIFLFGFGEFLLYVINIIIILEFMDLVFVGIFIF